MYKALSVISSEMTKAKTLTEKPYRAKITDSISKINKLLGVKEQKDLLDSLASENTLTMLMADCLQTKVKNLHSKEILMMEKEFQ